jgi:hypothetical protein
MTHHARRSTRPLRRSASRPYDVGWGNVQGSDRAAKGTARASAAVLLRSRVPGTAGNRREQPSASPSIYAGFPACSRLCSEYERIGETGFEPATARPPAGCATRLRHSPWQNKAGDGNRTRPRSLEGFCATTTLRPQPSCHVTGVPGLRVAALLLLWRRTRRCAAIAAPRWAPRPARWRDLEAATARTSCRARRLA